jgi:hypothetical protein
MDQTRLLASLPENLLDLPFLAKVVQLADGFDLGASFGG